MAIANLDEAAAMAEAEWVGLVMSGDGGLVATWAKESGCSIFVVALTLDCRTSRIEAGGFGKILTG
jgi:hypothetical protein